MTQTAVGSECMVEIRITAVYVVGGCLNGQATLEEAEIIEYSHGLCPCTEVWWRRDKGCDVEQEECRMRRHHSFQWLYIWTCSVGTAGFLMAPRGM